MQQFFAEPSWITESEILIRGADLNHMKNVLRMKVGEDVRINDGQGTTYLCCLNRYEKAGYRDGTSIGNYFVSGTSERR